MLDHGNDASWLPLTTEHELRQEELLCNARLKYCLPASSTTIPLMLLLVRLQTEVFWSAFEFE